jgi:hypothetical protein
MVTEAQLEGRIRKIQKLLAELGPMRPGSLSKQYNVCGTPGCRCKDPKHPRKHGPYYHLNYIRQGRNTTEFVKPADVAEVGRQLANYKRFRALTNEWVEASIELARLRKKRGSDGV